MRLRPSCVAILLVAQGFAIAGEVTTHIALRGPDDRARRLGLPSLAVVVTGEEPGSAAVLASFLDADVRSLVVMRPPEDGETPDYVIRVALAAVESDGALERQRFDASLVDHEGRTVWETNGRTEIENGALGPSSLRGTGRNVIAALIHDGWLEAAYDPENPPPEAPRMGRVDPRR